MEEEASERKIEDTMDKNSTISEIDEGIQETAEELENSLNFSCEEFSTTELQDAVARGSIKIVTAILDMNDKINTKDIRGRSLLHHAVQRNHIEIVKLLLNRGACVNASDENFITPLQIACKKNHSEIVEILLDSGAYVNFPAYAMLKNAHVSYTPLHYAAEIGSLEVTKLLLKYKADVNVKALCGTPVHLASANGDTEIVKLLLSEGADVNAIGELENLTPLYVATKNKQETTVKVLLEHGANVNIHDEHGITVLYLAVQCRSSSIIDEILKFRPDPNNKRNRSSLKLAISPPYSRNQESILGSLLEYGFCFNSEDISDWTVLHGAVMWGYSKIVEVLLCHGADVHIKSEGLEHTPLHTAAIFNREEVIKLLLKYGANVNAKDSNERTPISHAIHYDNLKIMELLLANGAKLDDPDLLITAVKEKSIEVVKFCLQHNSDINIDRTDNLGRTALYYSVLGYTNGFERSRIITQLLLDRGANANIRSRDGITALHVAVEICEPEAVEILLEYGAEVNAKAQADKTPLYMATERGHVPIVEILIKFGANLDSIDVQGSTALHIACLMMQRNIMELLLQNGCDINIKSKITPAVYELAFMRSLTQPINIEHRTYDSENAKVAIRHIARLNAKRLFISEAYLQSIDANPNLKRYYDSCEKEIREMKNTKICGTNVSFFEIFIKDIHQLTTYAKNKNIVEAFESYEYTKKFPIYAYLLEIRFEKGLERKSLLLNLDLQSFNSLINQSIHNHELPHHIVNEILSYLMNIDLRKLIDVCSDHASNET